MENKEVRHNPNIEEEKKQEKVPAIFGHIVKNYFSPVTAILENSIPEELWNKYLTQLKDFKTAVQENLDRGVLDEKQSKELLSRPNFIEEYDNFIIDFQKAIEEKKLEIKREELTNRMNNILNKIEDQKI